MSGMIQCINHGLQKSTLVSSRLAKYIREGQKCQSVELLFLDIEGIPISFYSDQKTISDLGYDHRMKPFRVKDSLEEFDSKEIIKPFCAKCVAEFLGIPLEKV